VTSSQDATKSSRADSRAFSLAARHANNTSIVEAMSTSTASANPLRPLDGATGTVVVEPGSAVAIRAA
jgi:hypothetical protein